MKFLKTIVILALIGGVIYFASTIGKTNNTSTSSSAENTEISTVDYNVSELNGSSTVASGGHRYSGLEKVTIPSDIPTQIKEYEGFTVNFNASNRTPNYVVWELLGSEASGTHPRSDNFWQDSAIKNCPEKSDYKNSGYDRGHMFPAADAKYSARAMDDCFVMANMCPQVHALNGGAWKTLEEKERLWAERDSALIIVAGPIYSSSDRERIGEAGVRVPSYFFKALLAPYLSEPRAIAFVYPNTRAPGNMRNYSMSIDELEELTGFDFFPALPDDVENRVESQVSFKAWDKR